MKDSGGVEATNGRQDELVILPVPRNGVNSGRRFGAFGLWLYNRMRARQTIT